MTVPSRPILKAFGGGQARATVLLAPAVLLALVLATAGTPEALAQTTLTLRIRQFSSDFYQAITDSCVQALDRGAQRAGLTTKVFLDYPDELKTRPSDTLDVAVMPTNGYIGLTSEPTGFSVLNGVATFSGPPHFAKFLKSDLYREVFKPGFSDFIVRDMLVAVAYGSTAQIFTSDKAIQSPDELRGRTQIGTFGDWWYANLYQELGINHDSVLGHTPVTLADQRAALAAAAGGYSADKEFIVVPLLMAAKVVPAAQRAYVTLSMTHMSLVSFISEGWFEVPDDRRALVTRLVNEASSLCSAENFSTERAVIDTMKRTGSTVVPVDVGAFQALSVDLLTQRLGDAKDALRAAQKAKGADDDHSIDTSAVKTAQDDFDLYTRIQALK